jgi:hypothetical protein
LPFSLRTRRAVWDQYTVLHLTQEAAEKLQRRLSKIADEYSGQAAVSRVGAAAATRVALP